MRALGIDPGLVRTGWAIVEPTGAERAHWRFSGIAVTRIQRVIRLQREFEVNLPGAALALDLLEEIERLRRSGGR